MRGAKSSISSISSSFSSWTGMGRGSRWALKWRNTAGAHVILYPLTIFFLVLTYSKTSATYLESDKPFRYQSSYPSNPYLGAPNALYHFQVCKFRSLSSLFTGFWDLKPGYCKFAPKSLPLFTSTWKLLAPSYGLLLTWINLAASTLPPKSWGLMDELEADQVSGKLPTYSSPKLTLTLTSHLGQNVGLGEG